MIRIKELTAHEIKGGFSLKHFDKNGNLKNIIPAPSKAFNKSNIELTISTQSGLFVESKKIPLRSLTPAFIEILHGYEAQGSYGSLVDTNGTTRSVGGLNLGNSHIVVGTSGVDNADGQYNLQAIIANGTGSGELVYGTFSDSNGNFTAPTAVSSPDGVITSWSRNFTNNSGAAITVREVGIHFSSTYLYLAARDTKDYNNSTINISVADGQVLTVKYNIYSDVSFGWTKRLFEGFMIGAELTFAGLSCRHQNGSYQTINTMSMLYQEAIADFTDVGLLVGTNDTPVTVDDYTMLSSLIDAGTGDGQLNYSGITFQNPGYTTDGLNYKKTHIRTVTNNSADNVLVKEIGAVGRGRSATTTYGGVLFNRRVIETVNLGISESLELSLTMEVNY